jgi:hypothetical protein
MTVVWIYVFWALVGGILGAVIAQSKNRRPWEGALLGVLLGLIGVLIVALLPKVVEAPAGPGAAVSATGATPRRRTVSTDERPAVAQARLDEAEKAIADGAYPKAFTPMYDESYEADRRGDVDALEQLLVLARSIEEAPAVHAAIRRDANELAERVQRTLERYPQPQPDDPEPQWQEPHAETGSENSTGPASPLDIVRERYARGEITREEFQQLTADLA